jgi:ABC-type nitrate/sulfonate/bicarbonate transport system substrate-binding protein
MIAALYDACAWCEMPENRPALVEMLSQRAFLNLPPTVISPSLCGNFDTGQGVESVAHFHLFHGADVNNPKPETGMELQTQMARGGLVPRNTALAKSLFRNDIYETAVSARSVATGPGSAKV